ncbi:2-dehydro-3-deoxygalactonokinase [Sphingomonas sp. Leaf343]|uniref:2-dehydro-3-deoxygalactonokinase n=1 Tax=Sphingomonas sp. Leaf343 TaxID=1736345 RepID=UPI0006F5EE2E|nr:2-dehydro-3-deoxygalactonokinase [Sphingomonas sp. Leaf343]KQR80386.1 2-oxo-3-deoxygalactonate kinase [Sphingomonas sp. Leaf343]
MTDIAFIAVDWGTTNRRAYAIDAHGAVLRTERDAEGILAVPAGGFPAAAAAIRARFDTDAPMLLAGMVGSNRGWIDAGYVPCPATLDAVAGATVAAGDGIRIVPGVSRTGEGRGDVMRGEEVQLFGAVAAGLAPGDALLCQPGTHCKWAWMAAGAIADFTTAMTGELFSLLKAHSLIGADMAMGDVADDAAFRAGAEDSATRDLPSALFGVRAAGLLSLRPKEDAASYVSGLLIGGDCHARLKGDPRDVYLLADPVLGGLYATAIDIAGGRAHLIDSHAAFVAGITRIQDLI